MRGASSVFVAGFALSNLHNPWIAVPAGIGSILLMVGAITGRCPTWSCAT